MVVAILLFLLVFILLGVIAHLHRRTDSDGSVSIQAAAVSNKGCIRRNNEDNFCLNGTFMQLDKMDEGAFESGTFRESAQLYAVCDGMGGTDAGEKASWQAVRELALRKQEYAQITETKELTSVLRTISGKINQEAQRKGQKSGTTIAMLLVRNEHITAVNVGDSRIYLLRDHKLRQMSVDHSRVQRMISMGLLTPEQAKMDPARHVITQYLGMSSYTRFSPYFMPDIEPEENDVYLLCSDGLTDMLEDAQIETILARTERPKDAAQELVKTALEKGGRDNVTVVVLRVSKN